LTNEENATAENKYEDIQTQPKNPLSPAVTYAHLHTYTYTPHIPTHTNAYTLS